jgi:hypothetical protein
MRLFSLDWEDFIPISEQRTAASISNQFFALERKKAFLVTVSSKQDLHFRETCSKPRVLLRRNSREASTSMQVSIGTNSWHSGIVSYRLTCNAKPDLPKNVSSRPRIDGEQNAFVQCLDPENSKCRHRLLILENGTNVGSDNKSVNTPPLRLRSGSI